MKKINTKTILIFVSIFLILGILVGTLLLFIPNNANKSFPETNNTTESISQTTDNTKPENNSQNNNSSETTHNHIIVDDDSEAIESSKNDTNKENVNSNTVTNQTSDRNVVDEDKVSKPTQNNDKTNNTSSSITIITPTKKDDSVFTTYTSFLSSVEKNEKSFSGIPKLEDCFTDCDCGVVLSGDFNEGTIKFAQKNHSHSWVLEKRLFTTHYNGTTTSSITNSFPNDGSMHCNCDGCELVVGKRYLYIKLDGKDHGHGWAWTEEVSLSVNPTPNRTEFDCGCSIYGDFIRGSLHVSDGHGHVWTFTETQYESKNQDDILEDCNDCGFKRWISKDGIRYIEFTCKTDNQKHILSF